jgi:hypothetical protein
VGWKIEGLPWRMSSFTKVILIVRCEKGESWCEHRGIMNEKSMTEMAWDIALAGNHEAARQPGNKRSVNNRSGLGHPIWSRHHLKQHWNEERVHDLNGLINLLFVMTNCKLST